MSAETDNSPVHRTPDGIEPGHLTAEGAFEQHASPLSLLVLGLVVALGLTGWAGAPWTVTTRALDQAQLEVDMPAVISTGDLYETRIRVQAQQDIGKLQIAMSPGLWHEMTVNTMIPAPEAETYEDGAFRYSFAALEQGQEFLFKIDAQVNPRFFGALDGDIRVYDDGKLLAVSRRHIRVMP
jgi:hypothetical protein